MGRRIFAAQGSGIPPFPFYSILGVGAIRFAWGVDNWSVGRVGGYLAL
jgi:hypothetical protein